MYPAVTHQSHRNTGRWDLKVCLGNECWGVFIEAPMVAKHGMTSLTSSKVGVLNRSVEPWYQWDHHIIWFIKRHVSKMLVIHGEFGNLLRYFGLGLFCVIWCFFCQQGWSWCNVGSRIFSLGFIWDGPIKHGWQRKSMIWRFHRVKDMDSVLGVSDGTKFCTNSWRKILYGSTKELITNFPCGTSSHNKKQLAKWPGFTVIEVVGQILWMNGAPKWILQPFIYL